MYILTKCVPVAEGGKGKWKLTAMGMYQGPVLKEFILEGVVGWRVDTKEPRNFKHLATSKSNLCTWLLESLLGTNFKKSLFKESVHQTLDPKLLYSHYFKLWFWFELKKALLIPWTFTDLKSKLNLSFLWFWKSLIIVKIINKES